MLDIPINKTDTNLHVKIQGYVDEAILATPNDGQWVDIENTNKNKPIEMTILQNRSIFSICTICSLFGFCERQQCGSMHYVYLKLKIHSKVSFDREEKEEWLRTYTNK